MRSRTVIALVATLFLFGILASEITSAAPAVAEGATGSLEGGALGFLGAGFVALALSRWLKRRP